MIRDRLRDEEYFKSRYKDDSDRLNEYIVELEMLQKEVGCTEQDEKMTRKLWFAYLYVHNDAVRKFFSGYSLGVSKEELKTIADVIIEMLPNIWTGDVYNQIFYGLALGIIFDIEKEKMNKVIELLEVFNYKDFILEHMVMYFMPDCEARIEKLKFKKSSDSLYKAIIASQTDKVKAAEELKVYLEKSWLKMQKNGIIDNLDHKTENQYRGYWSLEVATLVKILGLSNEYFKDTKYYPYDLLK